MARWKMLVGKFRYKGTKYRAGDVFEAPPVDVRGVRDQIEALDRVEEYDPEFFAEPVPRKKLVSVHRGFGKWDVVNTETNQNLNDHSLTKMEAKQLAEELEEKLERPTTKDQEADKKESTKDEGADDGREETTGSPKTVARKRRVPIGRGSEPEED